MGKANAPVKLSCNRIKSEYLSADGCLATALVKNKIVGHLIARKFSFQNRQYTWVTQLVVDKEYRGIGIATKLLQMTVDRDDAATIICSSHPAAIKAVEHAVGALSETILDPKEIKDLIEASGISYVQNCSVNCLTCVIDTKFYVCHAEVNKVANKLKQNGTWQWADLKEGEEYFAFIRNPPRLSRPKVRRSLKLFDLIGWIRAVLKMLWGTIMIIVAVKMA